VEVQSVGTCFSERTLLTMYRQNSQTGVNCAHSCATVSLAAPWSGQSFQDSTLRFRCADDDGGRTLPDPSGFLIDSDDNSFLTTMNNANNDYNFGLGAGYSSSYADFDSSTDDQGNTSDQTPRYLWIR